MGHWFGKFVRGKAFSALFCALVLGLILYLSSRLGALAEAFTGFDLRVVIFAAMAAFFAYMLAYFNSRKEDKKTRKLFDLCGILLCFFPNMALCFLLYDAAALLFGLEDSRLYLIPLLLSAAVTVYGFAHARSLAVKEYTATLSGKGQNFKLALLSDIHAGAYVDQKQLHKIISAVNQAGADMVVMAGDTFDQDAFGRCDLAAVKSELLALRPKGRIYAVLGNHDPHSPCEEVQEFFRDAGIELLIDRCVETQEVLLIGRDDILGNPRRKSLAGLLSGQPGHKPKVVIDHNPVGIGEGIEQNADLVLCGHTHKGQFFPATLFTKLAYGARGFYGHTITGHTHSIVSAGAGYFQLPMRIGTNSELVVIHVKFQGEEDQTDSNL